MRRVCAWNKFETIVNLLLQLTALRMLLIQPVWICVQEINTILYLSKNKKSISIKELQIEVWDHKSLLETHTVETHIHRLRKKIKEKFNDENFINSSKEGYSIN